MTLLRSYQMQRTFKTILKANSKRYADAGPAAGRTCVTISYIQVVLVLGYVYKFNKNKILNSLRQPQDINLAGECLNYLF